MIDTAALREKVLDLAIRGKLVPQDPNDEPASVLLERIHEQKLQMVREGKLKAKDVKDDTIIFKGDDNCYYEKYSDGSVKNIQDEIPFEIPQTWQWVRLGTIFSHNTGKALKTSNTDGKKLSYITTSNLYWDSFVLDSLKEMYFNESEIDKYSAHKGDLLVCEGGDIGRAAIWSFDYDIRIQNHIHKLRAYYPIETRLYYYAFYYYKSIGKINGNGIGIQGLSSNVLHNLIVPLPPVKEQSRIVTSVNNCFSTADQIDTDEKILQSDIEEIKSKILELAIQGKLVPQDENDEPASVLLERIRTERKEKLGKKYVESYIFKGDDNCYYENNDGKVAIVNEFLPFDLPDGWTYVRLENVLNYEQPTEYIVESTDYRSEYKTPVLTAGKSFIIGYTNETVGIKDELPVIIFDDFTTDSKYVDFPFKVKSSAMKILTADRALIDTKYAYYVMQTVECDHETHKRYWISEYGRTIIGLPPLKEQIKIVNQIEYLFSLLDNGKEP